MKLLLWKTPGGTCTAGGLRYEMDEEANHEDNNTDFDITLVGFKLKSSPLSDDSSTINHQCQFCN